MKNKNLTRIEEVNTTDLHDALVKDVRAALGDEAIAKLSAQPLCITHGGQEAVLQRACKEAAGFPDPVAAGVAKFRVLCGSRGKS
jgi:hypothetical protein